jgi:hypothetical protein
MPEQNELRRDPHTGQQKLWNGSTWMDFRDPNADQHDKTPWNSGDTANTFEGFKNLLTGAGSLAPMLLAPEVGIPLRVGAAALGGAFGRSVGHGMATVGHADQPSLAEDAGNGAVAGATGEVLPGAVGQGLKFGGRFLKGAADMLPDNMWHRAMGGEAISEIFGMPRGSGGAAGMAAKPLLDATGRTAERVGTAIGPKTTSQRLQDVMQGLSREPVEPVTHGSEMAAGAKKYGAKKSAQATYANPSESPIAAETSGLGADLGKNEPSPWERYARSTGDTASAKPDWPGMGPDAVRAESPSPNSVMFGPEPKSGGMSGDVSDVERTIENAQRGASDANAASPPAAPTRDVTSGSDPNYQELYDKAKAAKATYQPAPEDAMPADMPPSLQTAGGGVQPRVLPRRDELWGPGSTDMQGQPAQAEASRANLKYDPQTPTSYLREQLKNETDPAQQEFLVSALRQRMRLDRLPE